MTEVHVSSAKTKMVFRNTTDQTQYITLEWSSFRYRLRPGEELIFFHEPTEAIEVNVVVTDRWIELFVLTGQMEMFHPDGREAATNYEYEA